MRHRSTIVRVALHSGFRSAAALCYACTISACTSSAPRPDGPLAPADARDAAGRGVRLINPTARPIYYAAFERELGRRLSLAPCTDPARCPSVAPGDTVTIPVTAIEGYRSGAREALVFWWHLDADGRGGWVVADLRDAVLPIR